MRNMQERMLGAAKLDLGLYAEVEADAASMGQARAVVALSAVAAGIGTFEVAGINGIVFGTLLAYIGWYILAYVAYFVGAKFLPESKTNTTPEQLLRTIGFANAPGIVRVLAIVPGIGPVIFMIAGIWMLVALVIAVRQTLNYESTWRAVGVCVLGLLVQGIILITLVQAVAPFAAAPS